MRTLGSVFRRGKVYYVIFTHRGRRYKESSGSTQRKVAIALLRKRIAEVVEGRLAPRGERTTFADLLTLIEADYTANGRRSLPSLKYRLARLKATFGKRRPADIEYTDLLKYVEKRTAESASAATVRYELVALKRMFNLAIKAGMLKSAPPLPTIKLPTARAGFFEDAEVARVLAHLPADIAPAIEFAYITGWRIGEIRGLTWAQVDLHGGTVRLEPGTTKNDAPRVFPWDVHPRLGTLIREQRERTRVLQRRLGRVIPHLFWRDGGEALGTFRKAWANACKEAGCPGRLVHDLRRSAIRNLVRAGVPERTAMLLSGHRTRRVFDAYNVVSEVDLREAVAKLAKR